MIKVGILLGMMIASTSIGWMIRNLFVKRVQYLKDMVSFAQQLKNNIKSKKEKVVVFYQQMEQRVHKDCWDTLDVFFQNREIRMPDYLEKNETQEVKQFLLDAGHFTYWEEIENLDVRIGLLEGCLHNAMQKLEKYGNLSLKLSSLIGMLICIIVM